MAMKARFYTALTLLLIGLPLTGACSATNDDLDVKRISRTVAYALPLYHLNQLKLDENVSTNAFELFLTSLDPAHSYFLQADIDLFRKDSKTLARDLRKGDIEFSKKVVKVLLERIKNRNAYIKTVLEKGFDTSVDESFNWDRTHVGWPKDVAEWDELWRKRIKNEYVARLVSKQVYAEETTSTTNAGATVATNAVAKTSDSATTTNVTAKVEKEEAYDPEAEFANLTPEEYILERYKQYELTMKTFDDEMILQRYLSSFTHVYDPHSDYLSPSSLEDFNIHMRLSLVGIGAMLRSDDGMIKITRVMPGGPAEKDGRLKAGDRIVAVGQGKKKPVSILYWPLYKSVRLIRGEVGSTVVLSVIPAADRTGSRIKKIDLVREKIKLEEQAAKGEVHEVKQADGTIRKIGVITLPDFYADFKATRDHEKTARRATIDIKKIINELVPQKIEGLILDLRNNGGGSLRESVEIAGLFIPSGPIVQVKDRTRIEVLPDVDPTTDYSGPMIVLVNSLSASASEILAAALQDYKRAIIVGDHQTHGKGTVQTLVPLGTKRGSLKVTTAGFYRINGGSTQLKGVTPDIIIPSYLDVMGLGEKSLEHVLKWTKIRPSIYRSFNRSTDLIPRLAQQSKARLEKNEEFQNFLKKRARLKKRFDSKTVSLSLENRIAEAEAEKELDEIQNGSFLDQTGQDKKEKKDDMVLNETIHILSDMIDAKKNISAEINVPAPSLSSTNLVAK